MCFSQSLGFSILAGHRKMIMVQWLPIRSDSRFCTQLLYLFYNSPVVQNFLIPFFSTKLTAQIWRVSCNFQTYHRHSCFRWGFASKLFVNSRWFGPLMRRGLGLERILTKRRFSALNFLMFPGGHCRKDRILFLESDLTCFFSNGKYEAIPTCLCWNDLKAICIQ